MPNYIRPIAPGGTFFFTVVTEGREPFLCDTTARQILHDAIEACRTTRPFTLDAMVLLPDHTHAIWTLPPGDTDFSARWAAIKAVFTRHWLAQGGREHGRSTSRLSNRRRGVWQRRFYDHLIRDDADYERHLNYIHWNPVKHGLATCPHAWPFSTFHRLVQANLYERDWLCTCDGCSATPPTFADLDATCE
jgi:putative transposase